MSSIFTHIPHPHIHHRKLQGPATAAEIHRRNEQVNRLNALLAVKITGAVGTMWCAYLFAVLAMVSLPSAVRGGTATLISVSFRQACMN